MPDFADAGEAAMTAAAFQAGGKEVEAGVFRIGFHHPASIAAPRALKAPESPSPKNGPADK